MSAKDEKWRKGAHDASEAPVVMPSGVLGGANTVKENSRTRVVLLFADYEIQAGDAYPDGV